MKKLFLVFLIFISLVPVRLIASPGNGFSTPDEYYAFQMAAYERMAVAGGQIALATALTVGTFGLGSLAVGGAAAAMYGIEAAGLTMSAMSGLEFVNMATDGTAMSWNKAAGLMVTGMGAAPILGYMGRGLRYGAEMAWNGLQSIARSPVWETRFAAGLDLTESAAAEFRFAPALKSGLTRKLQSSIIGSLDDDVVMGVRSRPYQANFLDGKYPAKGMGADVDIPYQNGVRLLTDGTKVVSDLDTAFITKNGIPVNNSTSFEIYGKRINNLYGHDVVMHGDNYNGVLMGKGGALRVQDKNDIIYIFNKNGFIESGRYQEMIIKYIMK